MKKSISLLWFVAAILINVCTAFAPPEHGVYVQLYPGNSKKIVIQIVPDKTYADVVAYVNFYGANNKRVAQKAFSLSDEKEKYVKKDQCTSKVFKFSFDEAVARVTIDHVNEGEVSGKEKQGTKLNLPIANRALGPIEK